MRIVARVQDPRAPANARAKSPTRLKFELIQACRAMTDGQSRDFCPGDVFVVEADRGRGRLTTPDEVRGAAARRWCWPAAARDLRRRPRWRAQTSGCSCPRRWRAGGPHHASRSSARPAWWNARKREEAAELLRYEELLYDRLTGFPTLPVMIERARELLDRRGELTVLYIHFVWYEKIEEIYGWQKLDDVLETTAEAHARVLRARARSAREHPDGLAHRGRRLHPVHADRQHSPEAGGDAG